MLTLRNQWPLLLCLIDLAMGFKTVATFTEGTRPRDKDDNFSTGPCQRSIGSFVSQMCAKSLRGLFFLLTLLLSDNIFRTRRFNCLLT